MAAKRITFLCLIAMSLFLTFSPFAFAQEGGSEGQPVTTAVGWFMAESAYATIYVEEGIDLTKLTRRIDVGFARFDPFEKELFLDKGFSDSERLANKIDIIARKAKKILDMNPMAYHVNIKVYKDEEGLWEIYEEIFGERKEHKAFYIHKFKTIYISLNNVSESVLAHEIGHSVIDSYFAILPPQKIRELLASYVDVHLKD